MTYPAELQSQFDIFTTERVGKTEKCVLFWNRVFCVLSVVPIPIQTYELFKMKLQT